MTAVLIQDRMRRPSSSAPDHGDQPVAVRALGIAGAAGVVVFWAALASLHVLRPELSAISDYVSDYANGRWGSVFTVSVLAHGVGNVAITAGLVLSLGGRLAARLGIVAFAVATAGLLVAGVFPTDPTGAPLSVTGLVHRAASTGSFAVELLALALLAVAFRTEPQWASYRSFTLALTALAALLLGWLAVAVWTGQTPGLAERAVLGIFSVWEFSTALRLTRLGRRRAATPRPPREADAPRSRP